MTDDRLAVLERMPIFGGITEETCVFLLDLVQSVTKLKDEFFFLEGEPADAMYVIESGDVAVLKQWQGQPRQLRTLGPGDCFGEMAIIDLCPRSASVQALGDCAAMEITIATLRRLYARDPKQYAMFHMNMGREVSRRLRRANEEIFRARMKNRATDLDVEDTG